MVVRAPLARLSHDAGGTAARAATSLRAQWRPWAWQKPSAHPRVAGFVIAPGRSNLGSAGKADWAMGLIRGLFTAIGGLLAGVFGLLKGVLQGVGNLLRRLV